MAKARSKIALSAEEEATLLDEGHTLQLATIGADGFPHLVAMWYCVIDGKIWFSTYEKSQKVLNLERDPRLSVMIELGKEYGELRGLVMKGDAELVTHSHEQRARVEPRFIEAMSVRYGTPTRELSPKRVLVGLAPDLSYSWDHRKL